MRKLEWNNSLSVGVESMDNDHKKILDIINEITEAIESNNIEHLLDDVFGRLNDYIVNHFSREESLLEQCNYKDLKEHKAHHQAFIEKILKFQKKLESNKTVEIAQEINVFLINWLLKHIINEDMLYAQTMHDHGLASKQSKPFLKKTFSWIGKNIPLYQRVLLNAFIPITIVIIFGFYLLYGNLKSYYNIKELINAEPFIESINISIHKLQKERELSIAYINSNDKRHLLQLKHSWNNTDIATKTNAHLESALPIELKDSLALKKGQPHQKQRAIAIPQLNTNRKKIISKNATIPNVKDIYFTLIQHLLQTYNHIAHANIYAKTGERIISLKILMHLREVLYNKRLLAEEVFIEDKFTAKQAENLSTLVGEQQSLLNFFATLATYNQAQRLSLILTPDKTTAKFKKLPLSYTNNHRNLKKISTEWLTVLSQKIDQLDIFIDTTIKIMHTDSEQQLIAIKNTAYITLSILILILLLTFLSTWLLSQSLLYPIKNLTFAMELLTRGNKGFRFTEKFASDDIGALINAYENTRRKLIIADISSLVKLEKQLAILHTQRLERDMYKKLSLVDDLTGSFNRRKIIKLTEYEILKLKRYKQNLSLMMLDIDFFKKINDTYGHKNGDIVLKCFCNICQKCIRPSDSLARIGGEEFAILMPHTSLQQAVKLAERIRMSISKTKIEIQYKAVSITISITVSIGVTDWKEKTNKTFDLMLKNADEALYRAKDQGRDCVISDEK